MTTYDSSAIEVLTGLEPVRKRPGMYTTTERPNHLAQEVIDNAADEAIAGYCDEITATLHDDNSLSVADNGRGMPVDKHAKEGVTGTFTAKLPVVAPIMTVPPLAVQVNNLPTLIEQLIDPVPLIPEVAPMVAEP